MAEEAENNQNETLDKVVQEFLAAQLRGEEPDLEQFVRQLPDLEDKIRQKLQNCQHVSSLFDSLREVSENEFQYAKDQTDLTGTRLGAFEITEVIGHGGMGVVYKGHDTRLDRSVAIKSLPPELINNATARTRFMREAKLLASLSHPNIGVIHDIIEQPEGNSYLVLEYIPGQTLAERIAEGSLKLQEALTIALQIAEAIAAAHEHDVIHRDLKPGNIKITPGGIVKVLDFGLAKALGGESSEKPTTITQPGRLMGTPAYMSPEQARGKLTDKRSDIWSFGCVLYEMLTGKIPFEGETATDTLAHIIERQPDWELFPQVTPSNIRTLLRRCLEKDQRRRFQHMGDIVIEIHETLSPPSTAPPTVTLARLEATRRPKLQTVAIIFAGALICTLVVVAALWNPWRTSSVTGPQLSRFVINMAQGESIAGTSLGSAGALGSAVALSPDGTQLAYVVHGGDTNHLCLRSMEAFDAKTIQGTEGAEAPFFSPNGNWIGFFADGKLKKVSLFGGAPQTICEVQRAREGCWLEDDTIVFADEQKYGLWQVTTNGGEPKQLTTALKLQKENREHSHLFPHILPEGKGVLFTIFSPGQNLIAAFSFETGQYMTLIEQGSCAHYVQTGYLIYSLAGDLNAVPFDLKAMKVTGPSFPVVEGVMSFDWYEGAHFSVSQNGSLVYVPGSAAPVANTRIVRVDRIGKVKALPFPRGDYQAPRIAPDGDRMLVVELIPKPPHLWVFDLARGAKRRFTDDRGDTYWGIWSPDGKQIVFNSSLGGATMDLYSKPADGSSQEKRLTKSTNLRHLVPMSWADNGKSLIVTQFVDPNVGFDISILPYESAGTLQPLINTGFNEFHPMISHSGRWLAYSSDESGRAEIYIKPYPGPGGAIPVTTDGGREPLWDPSEKELYYRDDTGDKVFKVSILTEPTVQVGSPELLFEGRFVGSSSFWGRVYDISPQGDFFVLIEEGEMQPATQINVVVNWFEELKQLVPPGKE
jgi:serine/threonine protein kinase/Tol biopolymer transport system component